MKVSDIFSTTGITYIVILKITEAFLMFLRGKFMNIIIRNNSESPIYDQIKEQIKAMIISGELKAGDAIPSMRLLAKELRISIITTKRAYEELEREGYIESFTGKGSFVKSINRQLVKESVMCEIEELYEEILDKAKIAGISRDELAAVMEAVEEGRCDKYE